MLWWFSLAGILLVLLIVVPAMAIRNRRSRVDKALRHGPDIDEIMSEVESASADDTASKDDSIE